MVFWGDDWSGLWFFTDTDPHDGKIIDAGGAHEYDSSWRTYTSKAYDYKNNTLYLRECEEP